MTDILVPATPDPDYATIAAGVIRGILQIAASFGFTWALAVTGSQIQMAATAAAMVFTLLWSAWQKIRAKQKLHDAAIASAVQQKAVMPA